MRPESSKSIGLTFTGKETSSNVGNTTSNPSMSSAEDSRAKTCPQRESEMESKGKEADYTKKCSDLFPRVFVMENVSALLFDGMGTVCGDLAESGYRCEWATIPASRLGAPHQRDRIFILAYSDGKRPIAPRYFTRGFFESIDSKQKLRARSWPGERKPSESVSNRFRWMPGSGIRRMAHGVPTRMDRHRVRGLGNAVVPQVAELIGQRIQMVEER